MGKIRKNVSKSHLKFLLRVLRVNAAHSIRVTKEIPLGADPNFNFLCKKKKKVLYI